MKKENIKKLVFIVLIALVLAIWNPMRLTLNQTILLASLMAAVGVWATDALHKSLACLFLLLSFLIFGQTPAQDIFGFLWGDTNLLIMTTTLLSLGVMKTGIIHRYVEGLLQRFAKTTGLLLVLPYLISLPLTLLIPQAFARVIILGTILDGLLVAKTQEEQSAKSVLIFNAFISATIVYMLFSNGDVVLNLSVLTMAGEAIASQLTYGHWFQLMVVPVLLTGLVLLGLVRWLFRRELAHFGPQMLTGQGAVASMSGRQQKASLAIMVGVIGFWATSGLHGLPAWLIALVGVLALFALGILDKNDLSAVNPHFILFLMTIFSIGRVLGQAGVTATVFDHLKAFIPASQSPLYLLAIILVVMGLHLAIGSVVATISVVLPILLPLMQEAGYSGPFIVLMVYVLTNTHYLLPFQHATMLIGSGKKYYPDRYMVRYGLAMSLVTPLLLLLVYVTWWRMMG